MVLSADHECGKHKEKKMPSFERLTGERLHALRKGQDCHYDACVARLLDIGNADIDAEHDFLRSGVEAVEREFRDALIAKKHYHLVEQALIRIEEEYARSQIVPFPQFADHRLPPAVQEREHEGVLRVIPKRRTA
ncbi:MAG: hypothetical protein AAB908_02525 [Patescibacteria group bacterium]